MVMSSECSRSSWRSNGAVSLIEESATDSNPNFISLGSLSSYSGGAVTMTIDVGPNSVSIQGPGFTSETDYTSFGDKFTLAGAFGSNATPALFGLAGSSSATVEFASIQVGSPAVMSAPEPSTLGITVVASLIGIGCFWRHRRRVAAVRG